MLYLVFFLCFFYPLDAVASVEKNSLKWKNPLKIDLKETKIPQWSIREVVLKSGYTGPIHKPREVVVWFAVQKKAGELLSPKIAPSQLSISLWDEKEKIYEFAEQKFLPLSNDKYQIVLSLPPVSKVGEYKIRFQFYTHFNKSAQGGIQKFEKKIVYQREKKNFIFLIDNSGSMQKNDPAGKRISGIFQAALDPNIVELVQEIVIFTFSDTTELLYRGSPRITKTEILHQLSMQIPQGGTDIAKAMTRIAQYIKTNTWNGEVNVVFLTDGVPSTPYEQEHLLLQRQGVSVFSVGLSSSDTKGYDPGFLQKIADQTGGRFIASSSSSIKDIYQQIVQKQCNVLQKKSAIRLVAPEEVPLLWLFDLSLQGPHKIFVDGKPSQVFWKQTNADTLQLGLFPMNLGMHMVQIWYLDKRNKQQKYELSLQVVEKDQVYQMLGNFFQISLLKNQVLRIPFSLRNLQSQAEMFSVSFLDLKGGGRKFSAENISAEKDNLYLSAGDLLPNSMEIRVPADQPVGEYHGYFLVQVGLRFFIREISLCVKDTVPVPIVTKFVSHSRIFLSGDTKNKMISFLGLVMFCVGALWVFGHTRGAV